MLFVKTENNQILLKDLLEKIWQLKFKSVLIESGPRLISSFMKEQLIDRLHIFTAPQILGGEAPSWTKDLSKVRVNDAPGLVVDEHIRFDGDFYLSCRVRKHESYPA